MTELFTVLRGHQADADCMHDLGLHSQLSTVEVAEIAYGVALTALEAGFEECVDSQATIDGLTSTARAFKWADRDQPTRLFSGAEPMIGEQLVEAIFADRLPAVVAYLAEEAEISNESATDVLQVVATVAVATAIGGPDGEADLATQIGMAISSSTGGLGTAGFVPADAAAGSKSDDDAVVETDLKKRQYRILVGTAAVVMISGLLFIVGNGSGDEPIETLAATDQSAAETENQSDGGLGQDQDPVLDLEGSPLNDPADTADDMITGTDPGQDGATDDNTGQDVVTNDQSAANIVTYNVPMIDITNPTRGAEGILSFDFNTETGEVCYRVAATNINGPYRTHIHVGSVTEKGGIVVDMGPQESGAVGCLDNPPADINAILNDMNNYYAELHDVSEEWTIRGQISQAVELNNVDALSLTFDPDGGGAYLAIENGIAVLRGEVPDLLTATTLTSLYAPAGSGILVSNDLTVVAGAPVPSGRILLENHRFPTAGSDMPVIDKANQQTLEAILGSQQGWKLTAVGRTDGDGSELDNLELSLRRAKSLRTYVESLGVFDGSVLVRGSGELGFQDRHLELEFVPEG